jgi:hypothetical protein
MEVLGYGFTVNPVAHAVQNERDSVDHALRQRKFNQRVGGRCRTHSPCGGHLCVLHRWPRLVTPDTLLGALHAPFPTAGARLGQWAASLPCGPSAGRYGCGTGPAGASGNAGMRLTFGLHFGLAAYLGAARLG